MLPVTPTVSLEDALEQVLARLSQEPIASYELGSERATEPTAWASMALARSDSDNKFEGADWLSQQQASSGALGVSESQDSPYWPTALAILAWHSVDPQKYRQRIERAIDFALGLTARTMPHDRKFGHDSMIEGWSWAPETHSWLEPTAFFSVALRTVGRDNQRRSEAVRLLVDRLLPAGGANYGNTVVFGQPLLQHTQSSGIAAWALAGEDIEDKRLGRTLDFLEEAITKRTGLASLAWSARGLAAHRHAVPLAIDCLTQAWPRFEASGSSYKQALFALAAQEALKS